MQWLASVAPAAAAAARSISAPQPARPEEESGLEHAGERRLSEFRAGRAAARAALEQLGARGLDHDANLPRRASGAPDWPPGIVGSISHCDDLAVAIVARTSSMAQLGFDIEDAAPLDADLVDRVCRPDELTGNRSLATAGVDEAKLAFVAKEAWYKAVCSLGGEILDFRDVAIRLKPQEWSFEIEAPTRFGRPAGRFGLADGLLFALAWTPA
ncbi:MAG TPA: 4'-phosphopantetheinyl transferase superfamily protein [Caulobacteraceae bacterium]|jgi:4'-phosphopantetheinyl transferase EntD|nr:4'-phosphopantetheinyl transferase superfamily protein [Caulobacteraceae bacterium]